MPRSNVVMLENARALREKAAKARQLAQDLTDDLASDRLKQYAFELDGLAEEQERLAAELGQTIDRTRHLTQDGMHVRQHGIVGCELRELQTGAANEIVRLTVGPFDRLMTVARQRGVHIRCFPLASRQKQRA